jgi:hypothetical protein
MGKRHRRTLGRLYIAIAVKKQLLICEKYNFWYRRNFYLLNANGHPKAPVDPADFKLEKN